MGTSLSDQSRVFSTHVEVFPDSANEVVWWLGLLHARGGVSKIYGRAAWKAESSPRTWRCFS